ncbi:MAG: response regulator transcription factor, partial [Gammaproteobacteria bacterium]
LARSRLPNASLVELEGDISGIFGRDPSEVHRLVADFLELPPTEEADVSLTRRELEIVRLTTQGMRTKEIASFLGLSPATVDRHLANVYQKTGAHNRVALTRYALRLGLTTV